MKGKHTPGPWKMGHTFPDGDISILNENGLTTICTVHNHAADAATDDSAQRRNAETKANLNMIVAGPIMLAALKDVVGNDVNKLDVDGICMHCGRDNSEYRDDPCSDDCPGEVARAAIRVAETGRAE